MQEGRYLSNPFKGEACECKTLVSQPRFSLTLLKEHLLYRFASLYRDAGVFLYSVKFSSNDSRF